MSQPFCHHVNPAGVFCGGPPVNQRDYCFWHMHETGRRMKGARARAHSERVIINLPVLDDLYAVQVGLMQLAEAIAHGEIDHHSGRLLLSVLRLAASNLKSGDGWRQREQVDTFGVDSNIVTGDPGFERHYGLPKDINLNIAPEEAFPPPPSTVGVAPSEEPGRPAGNHRQRRDLHRREQDRKTAASQPVATVRAASTGPLAGAASPANPGRRPPKSSDIVSIGHNTATESGS